MSEPNDFRGVFEWCADTWAGRPFLDWVLGVLLSFLIFGTLILVGSPLEEVALSTRQGFYSLLAQITGIIVGFTMASYGILFFRGVGSRLPRVMKSIGENLADTWIGVIRLPLLAIPVFLAAFLFDGPPRTGTGWELAVLCASGIVTTRFARLLWLFRYLFGFALDDAVDSPAPPPALRDEYENFSV